VVGVDTDITTRKVIEQEMRRRNEELERANSELEEFAYIASHDLQEPLRTINIYTQLLLQRMNLTEDERAIEFARFISGGVERMQLLIRDVLAYARVVHREQEPEGPADLNRSFAEALKIIDGLVGETGAEITVGDLPVVRGQETQLAQVFQNLLSNALKYRKETESPRVRVSAERKDGEWLISVADNGIGFDPEYSERIFGLFRRLHKDDYPGTGIGLAICNRIVERYGGKIWATSPGEGRGATIFFTLRSVP
jgi:light-regulated signal transduction histidine kinase (bacteriophytochrome)